MQVSRGGRFFVNWKMYMKPLENLSKYEVLLASNSPRRRELLGNLGIDFKSFVIEGIDESYPDGTPLMEVAGVISRKKAEAYKAEAGDNRLIITADTVVICGGAVLGKPHDAADAMAMLRQLSGKTHQVVTGVTITTAARQSSFSVVTEVEFAQLTDDEIRYYVDTYNPTDKAGAYGIQEWIGCIGVCRISGSFYNVMGLPLQRLYTELKKF